MKHSLTALIAGSLLAASWAVFAGPGAIEGVEKNDVLPRMVGNDRFVEFFGRDHSTVTASLENIQKNIIGELIQFLDLFPLDIRLARVPEEPGEPCGADAAIDDADRQGNMIEQRGELAGGAGGGVHPGEDVLAQGGANEVGHRLGEGARGLHRAAL